jgi:hypothetical protein
VYAFSEDLTQLSSMPATHIAVIVSYGLNRIVAWSNSRSNELGTSEGNRLERRTFLRTDLFFAIVGALLWIAGLVQIYRSRG